MNNTETTTNKVPVRKPGLLKRIITSLDCAMKQKADAQRQNDSCCGKKDPKDGKCC